MKSNRIFFYLTVLSVFFMACEDRDDEVSLANIRIKNSSSITFDSVQVGAGEIEYLNVGTDDYSDYQEFEEAFEQDFIQIEANGETFVLQAVDSLRITPLPIGFYTYELMVAEDGEILLNFILD